MADSAMNLHIDTIVDKEHDIWSVRLSSSGRHTEWISYWPHQSPSSSFLRSYANFDDRTKHPQPALILWLLRDDIRIRG